jgi:hypothetical protein
MVSEGKLVTNGKYFLFPRLCGEKVFAGTERVGMPYRGPHSALQRARQTNARSWPWRRYGSGHGSNRVRALGVRRPRARPDRARVGINPAPAPPTAKPNCRRRPNSNILQQRSHGRIAIDVGANKPRLDQNRADPERAHFEVQSLRPTSERMLGSSVDCLERHWHKAGDRTDVHSRPVQQPAGPSWEGL